MSDHGSPNQITGCGMSLNDSEQDYANSDKLFPASKLRKNDSDLKDDIKDMRTHLSQILKMMEIMTAGQQEFMAKIGAEVASIKDQVSEIRALTCHLAKEQKTIKLNIQDLKTKQNTTEEQIILLKAEMAQLKSSTFNTSESVPSSIALESVVKEVMEREERSRNIIMIGVPELISPNKDDRTNYDKQEVLKITRMANNQCPEPEKLIRVGKYDPNKSRPIKISYKSQTTVLNLLRNRSNINSTKVKIFSDQTPQQQTYIKNLQKEMLRRNDGGEKDLVIRYIKGKPTIIKL